MAYRLNAQHQDFIGDKLFDALERMKIADEQNQTHNLDVATDRAYKYATILTALNIEFA